MSESFPLEPIDGKPLFDLDAWQQVPAEQLADEMRAIGLDAHATPSGGVVVTGAADMDPRELVWRKFPNDALSIATDGVATRCRSPRCQQPVWRGVTRATGKQTVFDVKPNGTFTGTNHWRTCLDREAFRRKS